MDASGLATLQSLRVQNTQTPALTIANTQPIDDLRADTNTLSSADVDAILIALDGNGLNNGTVNLSGQTPAAPPSAPGLAAKTSLEGKGWTVTVDSAVFSGPVWAPATEVVTWTDTNGTFSGDLATYEAAVDVATLSSLTFGATGNLTSLTGLNTAPNLATLDVNTNALTALDCAGLTALTTLNCSVNASLTTLTLTGCTALVSLDCRSCSISALNVSTCSSLFILNCSYNALAVLDCTNLLLLNNLDCSYNSIVTLTLTGCAALANLFCGYNSLISLDVTPCTAIGTLDCRNNILTTLTTTGCTNISTLFCFNNSLTSVSVSGLTLLTDLDCTYNLLTNGAGGSINVILSDMVINNPAPGFIQLNGQTPAAPPDAGPPDGASAKATLIGLGWSVTTD